MKRKWVLRLAAVLVLLVVAGTALHLVYPRAGIDPASFERIHEGMLEADVFSLLGGPPRNEDTNNPYLHFTRTRGERWEIWRGPHYAIAVYFDELGRVVGKDRAKDETIDESPILDRLLYILGLKKRLVVRE